MFEKMNSVLKIALDFDTKLKLKCYFAIEADETTDCATLLQLVLKSDMD